MYFENRERRSGTINILLNQKIHDENVASIKKEKEAENIKTFMAQGVFTELLYKLDIIVDEKKITSENIIFVVTNLMTVMHKYKNISGEQKKQSILFFILIIINKSDLIPDDKKNLIFIVENIVPGAIDVLVDVYKKKYILKYSKSCFKSLCCISKKN
jgi:hypothetical protein